MQELDKKGVDYDEKDLVVSEDEEEKKFYEDYKIKYKEEE
jgi:hypothetical protein